MKQLFARLVRSLAFKTGKARWLYLRICKPCGLEYAEYVRRHCGLHAMGKDCSILPTTVFTDPYLTSLGNNVQCSTCALIGHDGSIAMLNRAYNCQLDAVGPIVIRDNVFIGYGAIVLQNVTIGPNSIVAAGAVVTRDVPPNTIVAGVPARPIGRVDELVERLKEKTEGLPWAESIARRGTGEFDPALEPALRAMRVAHYFGETQVGLNLDLGSGLKEPDVRGDEDVAVLAMSATAGAMSVGGRGVRDLNANRSEGDSKEAMQKPS